MSNTIGINALFMVPNRVGGTEYHLRSTLKYLEKVDKNNSYVVFCNQENFSSFTFQSKKWKKICCPVQGSNLVKRVLYEQFLLPRDLKKAGCTILHSFGYLSPLLTTVPQVVTVHDANWRDHPEDLTLLSRIVLKFLVEVSLQKTAVVVTDSQFAESRLVHFFPQFASKIKVVQPGLDDEFLEKLKQKPVKERVPSNFILSINAFYPHKKVPYLLDLWQQLSAKNPKLVLVLIGQNGLDEKEVQQKIALLPRVSYFSKVSFKELAAFYKKARFCIIPSIYEGFGYPVYEAAAAGKEVVVGSRQLYDKRISSSLHQLTFDLKQDTANLQRLLKKSFVAPKTDQKVFSYLPGIHQLIKIYASF